MQVKKLFIDNFEVLAVVDGEVCPVEDFLTAGEATTEASRKGLLEMMKLIAENGLHGVPAKWSHEASKADGIFELIKGRLRVFYFKGRGQQIVVCTHGVMKKSKKAAAAEVAKAAKCRTDYLNAVAAQQLRVIEDEN